MITDFMFIRCKVISYHNFGTVRSKITDFLEYYDEWLTGMMIIMPTKETRNMYVGDLVV